MTFRSTFDRARAHVRHFVTEEKGLAATEFAIVLPFLLILYLGSVQVSQLTRKHSQFGQTAATINDVVSKLASVTPDRIDAAMLAGSAIAGQMGQQLRIAIVGVKIDDTGKATVAWSRSKGLPTPPPDSNYKLPASLTQAEGFVVATYVEGTFDWSVGDLVDLPSTDISYTYYNVPRSSETTECEKCNK